LNTLQTLTMKEFKLKYLANFSVLMRF